MAKLVHYELFGSMELAIVREKRLKKWNRLWKLRLIEESNPQWRDLWGSVLGIEGSQGRQRRRVALDPPPSRRMTSGG